jgi:hypothetical protein
VDLPEAAGPSIAMIFGIDIVIREQIIERRKQ